MIFIALLNQRMVSMTFVSKPIDASYSYVTLRLDGLTQTTAHIYSAKQKIFSYQIHLKWSPSALSYAGSSGFYLCLPPHFSYSLFVFGMGFAFPFVYG